MTHTVKAVAELAGISIRTLHHHDRTRLGLTEFMRQAMRVYGDRHEGPPEA